jgi:hypothetical protein
MTTLFLNLTYNLVDPRDNNSQGTFYGEAFVPNDSYPPAKSIVSLPTNSCQKIIGSQLMSSVEQKNTEQLTQSEQAIVTGLEVGDIAGELVCTGIGVLTVVAAVIPVDGPAGEIAGSIALGAVCAGSAVVKTGMSIWEFWQKRQNENLQSFDLQIQAYQDAETTNSACSSPAPIPDYVSIQSEASCFIPIRNFRQHEPGSEGYKTQLQIIFTDQPNGRGVDRKQITVPNPRTDLTEQEIAAVVGSSVNFGFQKCEVDMMPYGYIRYYAPDPNAGRGLIQRLSTLSAGAMVMEPNDTFRASNRVREMEVGTFYPSRAVLFDFSPGLPAPTCKIFYLNQVS